MMRKNYLKNSQQLEWRKKNEKNIKYQMWALYVWWEHISITNIWKAIWIFLFFFFHNFLWNIFKFFIQYTLWISFFFIGCMNEQPFFTFIRCQTRNWIVFLLLNFHSWWKLYNHLNWKWNFNRKFPQKSVSCFQSLTNKF